MRRGEGRLCTARLAGGAYPWGEHAWPGRGVVLAGIGLQGRHIRGGVVLEKVAYFGLAGMHGGFIENKNYAWTDAF